LAAALDRGPVVQLVGHSLLYQLLEAPPPPEPPPPPLKPPPPPDQPPPPKLPPEDQPPPEPQLERAGESETKSMMRKTRTPMPRATAREPAMTQAKTPKRPPPRPAPNRRAKSRDAIGAPAMAMKMATKIHCGRSGEGPCEGPPRERG